MMRAKEVAAGPGVHQMMLIALSALWSEVQTIETKETDYKYD